jgi:hypothetical protein
VLNKAYADPLVQQGARDCRAIVHVGKTKDLKSRFRMTRLYDRCGVYKFLDAFVPEKPGIKQENERPSIGQGYRPKEVQIHTRSWKEPRLRRDHDPGIDKVSLIFSILEEHRGGTTKGPAI